MERRLTTTAVSDHLDNKTDPFGPQAYVSANAFNWETIRYFGTKLWPPQSYNPIFDPELSDGPEISSRPHGTETTKWALPNELIGNATD